MSAFFHCELLCDADGCGETFNVAERMAGTTREIAAKQGWAFGAIPPTAGHRMARSVDYCSNHAALLSEGSR